MQTEREQQGLMCGLLMGTGYEKILEIASAQLIVWRRFRALIGEGKSAFPRTKTRPHDAEWIFYEVALPLYLRDGSSDQRILDKLQKGTRFLVHDDHTNLGWFISSKDREITDWENSFPPHFDLSDRNLFRKTYELVNQPQPTIPFRAVYQESTKNKSQENTRQIDEMSSVTFFVCTPRVGWPGLTPPVLDYGPTFRNVFWSHEKVYLAVALRRSFLSFRRNLLSLPFYRLPWSYPLPQDIDDTRVFREIPKSSSQPFGGGEKLWTSDTVLRVFRTRDDLGSDILPRKLIDEELMELYGMRALHDVVTAILVEGARTSLLPPSPQNMQKFFETTQAVRTELPFMREARNSVILHPFSVVRTVIGLARFGILRHVARSLFASLHGLTVNINFGEDEMDILSNCLSSINKLRDPTSRHLTLASLLPLIARRTRLCMTTFPLYMDPMHRGIRLPDWFAALHVGHPFGPGFGTFGLFRDEDRDAKKLARYAEMNHVGDWICYSGNVFVNSARSQTVQLLLESVRHGIYVALADVRRGERRLLCSSDLPDRAPPSMLSLAERSLCSSLFRVMKDPDRPEGEGVLLAEQPKTSEPSSLVMFSLSVLIGKELPGSGAGSFDLRTLVTNLFSRSCGCRVYLFVNPRLLPPIIETTFPVQLLPVRRWYQDLLEGRVTESNMLLLPANGFPPTEAVKHLPPPLNSTFVVWGERLVQRTRLNVPKSGMSFLFSDTPAIIVEDFLDTVEAVDRDSRTGESRLAYEPPVLANWRNRNDTSDPVQPEVVLKLVFELGKAGLLPIVGQTFSNSLCLTRFAVLQDEESLRHLADVLDDMEVRRKGTLMEDEKQTTLLFATIMPLAAHVISQSLLVRGGEHLRDLLNYI